MIKALLKSKNEGVISLKPNIDFEESEIPDCRECGSKMTQVITVDLEKVPDSQEKGHLIVFQCQADPGMCDDWDANSGANTVVYSGANFTLNNDEYCDLSNESFESNDELIHYMELHSECVGKAGGSPLWVQGDETPKCECGKKMKFIAQVKELAHIDFNFGGGGCCYIFSCSGCIKSKFLWQC